MESEEEVIARFAKHMQAIRAGIDRLEQQRPLRNARADFPTRSKIPYKIADYRAAIVWRFCEITRSSYEEFARDRLASAVLLARGAVETAAALWFAYSRVKKAIESHQLGDIDALLMTLLLGARDDDRAPPAIHVLKFLDHFDKEMEGAGLRTQYEHMCEVAHPNWAGTLGLYGQTNKENYWTDFGQALRGHAPRFGGATTLSMAMMIFEHAYSEIGDLMPQLVALCEEDLGRTKT